MAPQRSRTRQRKRLSLSELLLSAVLLPRAVYGHYNLPPLQAPILPPQLPLDGSETPSETHEFVGCLQELIYFVHILTVFSHFAIFSTGAPTNTLTFMPD